MKYALLLLLLGTCLPIQAQQLANSSYSQEKIPNIQAAFSAGEYQFLVLQIMQLSEKEKRLESIQTIELEALLEIQAYSELNARFEHQNPKSLSPTAHKIYGDALRYLGEIKKADLSYLNAIEAAGNKENIFQKVWKSYQQGLSRFALDTRDHSTQERENIQKAFELLMQHYQKLSDHFSVASTRKFHFPKKALKLTASEEDNFRNAAHILLTYQRKKIHIQKDRLFLVNVLLRINYEKNVGIARNILDEIEGICDENISKKSSVDTKEILEILEMLCLIQFDLPGENHPEDYDCMNATRLVKKINDFDSSFVKSAGSLKAILTYCQQ